jgi:hypothetical protein
VSRIAPHRTLRGTAGSILAVLVLLLAIVQGDNAQQKRTRKVSSRPTVKDSTAQVRADSIRHAEQQQAAADSLRKIQELLARRREDSLKALVLRTMPNKAFGVGERLAFDINYGYVTAGEAILSIPGYENMRDRKSYKVEVHVRSSASFSLFYKVEDHYLTFIDVETLAPWQFEQHIREGNYRRDFVATFDQYAGTAVTTDGGRFDTPRYVHDIMSAFYYVRALDLAGKKAGDLLELKNFYKDKTHDLVVRVLGRQELEVEAGTFRTIVVEPLVREGGLFKSEGRIVVWLTDDERKIPVRVNSPVVIGSIDVELREYSGVNGPINARIK